MCGIAAEIRLDGEHADAAAIGRITAALRDRGPDGSGIWARDGVALGHRRLSIIDLSERGGQPMVDAELGLAIAFNGMVYNYRELRAELEGAGYSFVSTSDTEVLLKAYHRWGPRFVERLRGMFAFALCEVESGRVVIGRDRLGIKPLYVAEDGRRIRLASSVPALLAAGDVDTSIDPVALHHYLSWHAIVPPPRTILRGVRKIPPATLVTIEPDGRRHDQRYWQATFERTAPDRTPEEWAEAVRESLRAAVRRRMVADVPVGVLLSGGLDSSLIVALLAEEGQAGLRTFSIGFEAAGGQSGDEFEHSDLVAREFATEHEKILIPSEDLAPAARRAVRAMSEPMTSHDVTAFYLLSERVSEHVKVVQSGQGADEVFAGYHWYPPLADASPEDAVGVYAREFFDRAHEEIEALVGAAFHVGAPVSREFVAEHFARPGAPTALDRALRLDQEVMLVDDPVKRVDNMTMAHGLEARVPFLDHDLVELAAACPPELKVGDGGKGVLKAAARGVVPDAIIDRKKGYFPVPGLVHLEGSRLELVRDALLSPEAERRGLFDRATLERMLADPEGARNAGGSSRLWQLGVLELWLQAHGA